jgi:transcription elongation factor
MIKSDDIVYWRYEHALNSKTRIKRAKLGVVLDVKDDKALILLHTNKKPYWKNIKDLEKAGEK